MEPQSIDRYTFSASAGQSASLSINTSMGQVLLNLLDPSDHLLTPNQSSTTSWLGKLPTDGTYTVYVFNQQTSSSYNLELEIMP